MKLKSKIPFQDLLVRGFFYSFTLKRKMSDIDVTFMGFPTEQYYRRETQKKQIVLHHTVSPDGVISDINWWKSTPERIATHFIISRQGKIYQLFNTRYWGHHLGVKHKVFEDYGIEPGGANVRLNMGSIGIELDSWGGLKEPNEHGVVDFVEYKDGFRGYSYFEAYTKEQISTCGTLIKYLCEKYSIPMDYNEDMWDVSVNALNGVPGIWTHVSYRKDKSDCHPQATLIEMIKNLIK